jgi:TonB family protein
MRAMMGRLAMLTAAALLLGTGALADEPVQVDPACPFGVKVDIHDTAMLAARIAACTGLLDKEQDPARRQLLLIGRSEAYYMTKRPLRALADLDLAEAADPDLGPPIVLARALVHAHMEYYALALPEIQTGIDAGAAVADAYVVRGAAQGFQGNFRETIADADLAIADDPSKDAAYSLRGFANLELGELGAALKDFNTAILLNAKEAAYFTYRGRVHYALDQYDAAIADFTRARALDPSEVSTMQHIAELTALVAVPLPDPHAPPPLNAPGGPYAHTHNCGGYYPYISGRLHEGGSAILHYDAAADGTVSNVGLEQSSNVARLDQAAVICVSRHWRNTPAYRDGVAVATLHRVARIVFVPYAYPPTDPGYAAALAGVGRYDEAITELTRIIGLQPDKADLYLRRGFAYFIKHDDADATRDFDKAASLTPGDDEALAGGELVRHAAPPEQPPHGAR